MLCDDIWADWWFITAETDIWDDRLIEIIIIIIIITIIIMIIIMIIICRRHWDMRLEVLLTLIVYVAWWYMSRLMIYNSRDWYMRWSTFEIIIIIIIITIIIMIMIMIIIINLL